MPLIFLVLPLVGCGLRPPSDSAPDTSPEDTDSADDDSAGTDTQDTDTGDPPRGYCTSGHLLHHVQAPGPELGQPSENLAPTRDALASVDDVVVPEGDVCWCVWRLKIHRLDPGTTPIPNVTGMSFDTYRAGAAGPSQQMLDGGGGDVISPDDGLVLDIALEPTWYLPAGRTWFSAQFVVAGPDQPTGARWRAAVPTDPPTAQALFRDTTDALGLGCTEWQTWEQCSGEAGAQDLAFELIGTIGYDLCPKPEP